MILRIQLILAIAGMSAIIAYAWWLHQRVWKLRSDLFSIRDDLWTTMLERGELDEPSHRKFRDGINAMIRVAPMLSLFTFIRLVLNIEEVQDLSKLRISSEEEGIAAPVLNARNIMFARVARYLLLETISGLTLVAILLAFDLARDFQKAVARRVEWLFDLHVFERYNQDMSPIGREAVEVM